MPASKQCTVQRAFQAIVVGQQPAPRSALQANGVPAQALLQIQQFANMNHELRMFGDDYEMYCVWCGQMDSQINWVIALALPEETNAQL